MSGLLFVLICVDVFDACFDVLDVYFDVFDACFDVFDVCFLETKKRK